MRANGSFGASWRNCFNSLVVSRLFLAHPRLGSGQFRIALRVVEVMVFVSCAEQATNDAAVAGLECRGARVEHESRSDEGWQENGKSNNKATKEQRRRRIGAHLTVQRFNAFSDPAPQ